MPRIVNVGSDWCRRYGVSMPVTERTAAAPEKAGTTIGVLGHQWRATVSPAGTVDVWDGRTALRWYVAADDRWHTPETEPTVRQTTRVGTPVIETRLRIPSGDAIHRVYAVADHGGLTVIEVENDSPLPIAVAFSGAALLSVRPPTASKVVGIDLPDDTVLFPVGHHAMLTVAMAHHPLGPGSLPGQLPGQLPSQLPTAQQVANGWSTMVDRASRLLLPDPMIGLAVTHQRCELLLGGPAQPDVDTVSFLIGAAELVRLGQRPDAWVAEVADAVHRLARRPADEGGWDVLAAFDAAETILTRAGERRAAKDLARLRSRTIAPPGGLPAAAPEGARLIAWAERRIAIAAALLPAGLPVDWLGQNFEVFDVPTGPSSAVSFALRWHGDRPAVLWECSGTPVSLTSPNLAPDWSSKESTGEALWPAPQRGQAGSPASAESQANLSGDPSGDSVSFS